MNSTADTGVVVVSVRLVGSMQIGSNVLEVSDLMVALEAIGRTKSIKGLSETLGLSYRTAWCRLQMYEVALGQPLVRKTRGQGSELTEFGAALAEALTSAVAGLDANLGRETRAIEHRLRRLLTGRSEVLTLAASHDPLLIEVLRELPAEHGQIRLSVMGSSTAVKLLLDGGVDAAGFHCGALTPEQADVPFSGVSSSAGLVPRPLFEREQGLLLAPGNPLGIRTLADLTAEGVRYVNRQPGSGTRSWFDRMLAKAGLSPDAIQGYAVEEFTHQAVAAMVACGAADAGLGVRVAAERLGLDFLSVGWETYYLAASRSLASPMFDELVAAVRVRAAETTGYRLSREHKSRA
ncbi:substrate-binding domain-containing protein [Methylorubrum extorquens]|uniref:Helix-turn-helix transcriptional regulator n=1 Tax=Methylorubrum extorquens TaxID=408 RepID=A0AAX3WQ28_METEX|nr:substrate-binding domain-containing protein [Methylorubrum extorquens]KQO94277.1 LuxR family transcriptional regulator [Methylobacterium sp. Leaf92]WHQ72800.1 helix-turn-helix transcriptional regulator [Methylorubrum extorquens]